MLLGAAERGSRGGKDGTCVSYAATGGSGYCFWSNICLFI